jgi:hypothetical protein
VWLEAYIGGGAPKTPFHDATNAVDKYVY